MSLGCPYLPSPEKPNYDQVVLKAIEILLVILWMKNEKIGIHETARHIVIIRLMPPACHTDIPIAK